MTGILIRGRLLSFHDEPSEGSDGCAYIEDGAVWVSGGKITAAGEYSELAKQVPDGVETIDHRPNLILPGFIDTHIHYPQAQMVGSPAPDLLTWLNTYTFVEEQKFGDPDHASRIASRFFDVLIGHGTTTAAAYCSVHPESVDAYFGEAQRRGLRMIGGKVMMDRNAPDALCDTPVSSYDDSKAMLEKWEGVDRLHYAITPRFAITSSPEQMEAAQALFGEHPDVFVQTHLSENHKEIAFSMELYPEAKDYTDIYFRYGLLSRKTLLGHCIHLSKRETGVLAETGAVAVFCPTSNLFLGSGLFNFGALRGHDPAVNVAIATDIGGGTSYSMLRTLDEANKVLQLQGQCFSPFYAYYQATLGNARALQLEQSIGTLDAGSDADLVVLDCNANPALRLRMETATTLEEELFAMQTLGDDRTVAEVYVAGEPAKSTIKTQA